MRQLHLFTLTRGKSHQYLFKQLLNSPSARIRAVEICSSSCCGCVTDIPTKLLRRNYPLVRFDLFPVIEILIQVGDVLVGVVIVVVFVG